jgi:hypothetical protein
MKNTLIIFLCFLSASTLAQVNETFSDGNFSHAPIWEGNTSNFVINSNAQLQLNAPVEANKSYLVASSNVTTNAEWKMYCKMMFTPSSANNARWYLIADKQDITGSLNGYYLLIGNTSKNICLYKQTGTTSTKILDTPINRLNGATNEIHIRITRSSEGLWQLFTQVPTENSPVLEGSATDNTHKAALYTGIVCYYTATRSTGFIFDDIFISGETYEPPILPSYKASFGDIVFNEIMANPNPPFGLPNVEYIELYNNTSEAINLENYALKGFTKTCIFPTYILEPNAHVIICNINAYSSLEMYGNCLALDKFPTLTNSGGLLELYNAENTLISWLDYSENWHTDSFKKNGGWSLECIDARNLIGNQSNWNSSISYQGGTPNGVNSIAKRNPESASLQILYTTIESNTSFILHFNKALAVDTPKEASILSFSPSLSIASLEFVSIQQNAIRIKLANPLLLHEQYKLNITDVEDINKNKHSIILRLAIPELPSNQDVVINEVLFNPKSGGADYVEIVNRSQKVIDLRDIMLTNRKQDRQLSVFPVISEKGYLLFPGDYCLLSTSKEGVCNYFECPDDIHFVAVTSFPSMPDDNGTLVLTTLSNILIDEFSYSEKMHHTLLSNREGIALERLHYDITTQDASNWHSASFTSGYGTPGYQNSQFTELSQPTSSFHITPKSISPNNDGNEDTATIYYSFDEAGYLVTIRIFNANGNCVKTILQNALISTEGITSWDGTDDAGKPLPIGIYIVTIDAFTPSGKRFNTKEAIVLSAKN